MVSVARCRPAASSRVSGLLERPRPLCGDFRRGFRNTLLENEMPSAMEQFDTVISSFDIGPLDRRGERRVLHVLAPVWESLEGSDDQGMDSSKLGRIEDVIWQPPLLRFRIERHGGIVGGGSSRAELQFWCVNVVERSAWIDRLSWRQIGAQAPRFDVKPEAERIAALIVSGEDDPALTWTSDHRRVEVHLKAVLPQNAVKATTTERSKRLYKHLDQRLSNEGWTRLRNRYYRNRHERGARPG